MAQVWVTVSGRRYAVACKDGEEPRLQRLAATVAARALDVEDTLGQTNEPRLLLMAALLLADDLLEARERLAETAQTIAQAEIARERLEHLAAELEAGAGND